MAGVELRELHSTDVRDAILVNLHRDFPEYTLYDENVPQGFVRPSFAVRYMKVTDVKQMGELHYREYRVRVRCYHDEGLTRLETTYLNVAETLHGTLRQIIFNDGIGCWGKDLEYEIIDNVLHFTVTYSLWAVWDRGPIPLMQTLDTNVNYKD